MKRKINTLLIENDNESNKLFVNSLKSSCKLFVYNPKIALAEAIETERIQLLVYHPQALSPKDKKAVPEIISQLPQLYVICLEEDPSQTNSSLAYLPNVKTWTIAIFKKHIKAFLEKIAAILDDTSTDVGMEELKNRHSNKKEEEIDFRDKCKKCRAKFEKQQKQLEAIYDSTPGVIFLYDEDENLVQYNKKLEEISGYSGSELKGIKLMDWFKNDYASQEIIYSSLNKIALQGFAEDEVWIQRKDGISVPLFVSARAVQIGGKNFISGVAMDLSDLKAAEAEAKESDFHYDNLYRNLSCGLVSYQPIKNKKNQIVDFKILNANRAFCKSSGLTMADIKEHSLLELYPNSNPKLIDILRKAATSGKSFTKEMYFEVHKKHYLATSFSNGGESFSVMYVDITSQKKEKQEFENAISFANQMMDYTDSPMFVKNNKMEYLLVNEAFCKLVNKTKEEIIGNKAETIFNNEQKKLFDKLYHDFSSKGDNTESEITIKDAECVERKFKVKLTEYVGLNDKKYLVGILNEIWERKNFEDSPQQADQFYKMLFEKAHIGLALCCSQSGKFITFNNAYAQIVGYSTEEMNNIDWRNASAPEVFEKDTKAAEKPVKLTNSKRQLVRLDGSSIWTNLSVLSIDPENPNYCLCIIEDISEKVKAEEALRESNANFRSLFEKGPIGIAYQKMIYDEKGEPINYLFLESNEGYKKLTGVNPTGKLVTEAFPGIEKDTFDWIGRFGQVAKYGTEIRFQQYFELINRWYDCVAYQYKPDHFCVAFLDITEQKQAALALKESELELDTLIANLPGFVYRSSNDAVRSLIYLSDGCEEISGYTKQELIENREIIFDNIKLTDLTDKLSKTLEYALKHNTPYSLEYEIETKKGVRKWVLDQGRGVFDEQGVLLYMEGFVTDISNVKIAEKALKERERELDTIIANLPGFVYRTANNKNRNILYITNKCKEVTGYSSEDLIKNQKIIFEKLIVRNETELTTQKLKDALRNKTAYSHEYEIETAQGDRKWVLEQGQGVFDKNGELLYQEGFVTDISKVKIAEKALAETKFKLEAMFSGMNEVVALYELQYDENGQLYNYKIIDCNQSLCKLVKMTRAEIVGKLYTEVFQVDTASHIENFKIVAANKTNFAYTVDNKAFDRQFQISVVYVSQGTIATIATDITDLTSYNRKLTEKNKELLHFQNMMVGRELRMIDLKKEVNALLKERNMNEKYKIVE